VHAQYPSKILLAIGKVSGSFEIWLCDISSREFDKLGSYYAHDCVVSFFSLSFLSYLKKKGHPLLISAFFNSLRLQV